MFSNSIGCISLYAKINYLKIARNYIQIIIIITVVEVLEIPTTIFEIPLLASSLHPHSSTQKNN